MQLGKKDFVVNAQDDSMWLLHAGRHKLEHTTSQHSVLLPFEAEWQVCFLSTSIALIDLIFMPCTQQLKWWSMAPLCRVAI
jgi:hypothetical protein